MTKQFEGRLLNQRYELLACLGENEILTVWKASDTVLARTVIVKIIKPHAAQIPGFIERFHAVSIAAARLSHAGIIAIFDTGCDTDYNYVVLEWLDGMTLQEALIARQRQGLDNFAYFEVARIGRKVASALAYAHHAGMLHGNLQPSKIFITNEGDVKVTDFGLTTDPTSALLAAPEVVNGGNPSSQSDVYALGLIMYECLTGINPANEHNPDESHVSLKLQAPGRYIRDLPPAFNELVVAMISRYPGDRPDKADDVARILRPFEWKPALPIETIDEPREAPSLLNELTWIVPVAVLFTISGFLMWQSIHKPVTPEATPNPVVATAVPTEAFVGGSTFGDAKIVDIIPFDPQGDRVEMNNMLPNLLSTDPSKYWQTELYHNPYFGDLKTGVGVILDLGKSLHIQNIVLTTSEGGFHVDIATGSEAYDKLEDWHFISIDNTITTGENTLHVTPGQASQYVLVWIKGPLPASGDMFRARVNTLSVTYQQTQ